MQYVVAPGNVLRVQLLGNGIIANWLPAPLSASGRAMTESCNKTEYANYECKRREDRRAPPVGIVQVSRQQSQNTET